MSGEGKRLQRWKGSRRERKELARRLKSDDPGLDVVHPDAAGIDIGNESHYVAVSPQRDAEPVREFGCFTSDLHRLARWLKQCGVKTVAMQSTGVYWIAVYDILEEYDLEVYLVNAKHTKNLPGRKTDVQESQWLLKLHTYGLLRNSFRPPEGIRTLRTYWRHRAEQVQGAAECIQRMQKVLTQMNVQLANVISDLSGTTGQAIVRAIVAGERDPHRLAQLRNYRVQASEEEVARSLQGNWRKEMLFALRQELELYDFYRQRVAECDKQLETELKQWPARDTAPVLEDKDGNGGAGNPRKPRRKPTGNLPQFNLAGELERITGVDLTRIDGVDLMTAQTVISEAGLDMSCWKTEAHFVSWLGLCPRNEISGGKVLKRATRHVVNRIASALRMAATTLLRSQTYLGAQYRRLRTRLGAPKAITAMANRLARLIYRMLKHGNQYVDKGLQYYEEKYRAQQIRLLRKKALQWGYQLTQVAPASS